MKRRTFIAGLGSAVALPQVAGAQQRPIVPVIGLIVAGSVAEPISGSYRGLLETGYVDGRNLIIKLQSADYRMERMPELVADLVQQQAAVIVVFSTPVRWPRRPRRRQFRLSFGWAPT